MVAHKWDQFMEAVKDFSEDRLWEIAKSRVKEIDTLWNIPPDIEKYLRTGDESLKRDWPSRSPAYIAYWITDAVALDRAANKHQANSWDGRVKEYFDNAWSELMEDMLICQP